MKEIVLAHTPEKITVVTSQFTAANTEYMRRAQSRPWPTAHFASASFSKTSYTLEPLANIFELLIKGRGKQ